MQIRKWSETLVLIIAVLKVFFMKPLVMIWPVFSVTLVSLFMVDIIPFWYVKFKKSWTFFIFIMFQEVKTDICNMVIFIGVFVFIKKIFKKFSNGSILLIERFNMVCRQYWINYSSFFHGEVPHQLIQYLYI